MSTTPRGLEPAEPHTATPGGPPTQHPLARMVWIAVFPPLTGVNLSIGPRPSRSRSSSTGSCRACTACGFASWRGGRPERPR